MPLPLIPILGPAIVRGLLKLLPGRIAETWAPRVGKAVALALVVLALWLGLRMAIGAIREDAREDLLLEQAAERAAAADAQREREYQAAVRHVVEIKAGAAADAAQQKEKTDATKDLPDARPSARQRARRCVELQRQDEAAGRAARPC